MSRRNQLVLRTVPVQTNVENLDTAAQKPLKAKSAPFLIKNQQSAPITSFFKSVKSTKGKIEIFRDEVDEDTENCGIFYVDKAVTAAPSTSDSACQTEITSSLWFEDPKLTLADLKSPRPTATLNRRRITKLKKETQDILNDSLELSINESRDLVEISEIEEDIESIVRYEIDSDDLKSDEEEEE